MESVRFRSRVDAWLCALVFGPIFIALWFIASDYVLAPRIGLLIGVGMCVVALATCLWIFLGTSYTLTPTDLIIRSGPARVRVSIDSIRRVARTSSLIAAPALSLHRLEITHGKYDSALISPLDLDGFILALVTRNPGIEVKSGVRTVAPAAGRSQL